MMIRYSAILLYFFGFLALCGCRDSSEENSKVQKIHELETLSVDFKTTSDVRDRKMYRIISSGNRDWMAENLNFQTENSWCYRDSIEYCEKYGRLYSWEDAMKACPEGWKLPDNDDWQALRKVADQYKLRKRGGPGAGTALMSKEGWRRAIDTPSGSDMLGFAALPGGMRKLDGSYQDLKSYAFFWSATKGDSTRAYVWDLWYNGTGLSSGYGSELYSPDGTIWNGFSVRCVRRLAL